MAIHPTVHARDGTGLASEMSRVAVRNAVGALGVICGLLPVAAQASGHLPVDVHGFGAFVVVQSVWYLATAVQLIRNRI